MNWIPKVGPPGGGKPTTTHLIILPSSILYGFLGCFYTWRRETKNPTFKFWLKFNSMTVGVKKDESLWLEKTLSDYAHSNPLIGSRLYATRNAIINLQASTLMGHIVGGVAGYYGVFGTKIFYEILGNRWFAAFYASSFFALTMRLTVPEIFLFLKAGGRKGAAQSDELFKEYLREKAVTDHQEILNLQDKTDGKDLTSTLSTIQRSDL